MSLRSVLAQLLSRALNATRARADLGVRAADTAAATARGAAVIAAPDVAVSAAEQQQRLRTAVADIAHTLRDSLLVDQGHNTFLFGSDPRHRLVEIRINDVAARQLAVDRAGNPLVGLNTAMSAAQRAARLEGPQPGTRVFDLVVDPTGKLVRVEIEPRSGAVRSADADAGRPPHRDSEQFQFTVQEPARLDGEWDRRTGEWDRRTLAPAFRKPSLSSVSVDHDAAAMITGTIARDASDRLPDDFTGRLRVSITGPQLDADHTTQFLARLAFHGLVISAAGTATS